VGGCLSALNHNERQNAVHGSHHRDPTASMSGPLS
jgi:hypothetical protein